MNMRCVANSPDGKHIISGSDDNAIRIWDADTSVGVGKPLVGHTDWIRSVVYSPSGQHIISASHDRTIRVWDAKAGAVIGMPLMPRAGNVMSIACSPDGKHIASGSWNNTIHVWGLFPHPPIQLSLSCDQAHANFCAQPDANGWVRYSNNGLLYWVPPDCRTGLHPPAVLTIPPTSNTRSVTLDFDDFVFGTSWTQVFNST